MQSLETRLAEIEQKTAALVDKYKTLSKEHEVLQAKHKEILDKINRKYRAGEQLEIGSSMATEDIRWKDEVKSQLDKYINEINACISELTP